MMIVLDSSAIVCALAREPEAGQLAARLSAASAVAIGAPTVLESALVLGRRNINVRSELREYLDEIDAAILDFTASHWTIAYSAFERFGKGSGHRAQLNFGDCISYAFAHFTGAELVYKGDDFAWTDLRPLHQLKVPA